MYVFLIYIKNFDCTKTNMGDGLMVVELFVQM